MSWTYTGIAHGYQSTTIESRAVDDSGNIETPSQGISVNVGCPCSLFGTSVTPATAVPYDPNSTNDSGDGTSVTVGVKFTSDVFGQVSAIRFYKASTNTGTHVGSLWSSSGQLLASATFTNETTSGWQTVTFSTPVTILPGTTYVAGYFAPSGHYSATDAYFYANPAPTPMGGANRALHLCTPSCPPPARTAYSTTGRQAPSRPVPTMATTTGWTSSSRPRRRPARSPGCTPPPATARYS